MKVTEVTYKYRMELPASAANDPGKNFNYEELTATAEVEEGQDPKEVFKSLRELCISQSTKYKVAMNKS